MRVWAALFLAFIVAGVSAASSEPHPPAAAGAAAAQVPSLRVPSSEGAAPADASSTGPPEPGAASKASANTATPDPARAEFLAALTRVRSGLPDLTDSAALERSPIYPYLVAARLRRDLTRTPGEALDASIDAFLKAHAGEPVSRPLRHDWLLSLAQRGEWTQFLPRANDAADPVLICERLRGRLATGDLTDLATEALARWSLPQRQPPECTPAFDWLEARGLLTPARLETRARAALAADNPALAREIAASLPAAQAQPLLAWAQLLESPKSSLDLLAMTPAVGVEAEALVAGFTRLAYTDPSAAGALLPLLGQRPDMTSELRHRLERAAALGAAFAHQPDALERFSALDVPPSDTLVEEWRVRAALWAADYDKARAWIDAMPTTLAAQARWRYWRARAVAAVSGNEAAERLFAALADTRDYFGYLAADRLHRPYDLNMHATSDDANVQAELAAEPALIRARALFECDLTDDAQAEWAFALASAKPAVKIQAARLAARWGWYAESITTLAQADEFDDVALRYPRPYAGAVAKASRLTRMPPDWILAVMRQESLFRKDAVSRADARGLMQMQPATATAVARRWHWPRPVRDELFEPDIAVPLGAAYVRELLDRYDQQLELALAAYNAGPVSVARWLPQKLIAADVWIENIPYAETRAYVQHVLEHIVAFAAVRAAEPPRLSTLLPPVSPLPTNPEPPAASRAAAASIGGARGANVVWRPMP